MIKNSSFYIFQIDKIRLVDYNDGEFGRGGVWMELTKSEMEIMDVLWESGQPLSRSDLLERSEEKTWKDSSVHILLNGLLQRARSGKPVSSSAAKPTAESSALP